MTDAVDSNDENDRIIAREQFLTFITSQAMFLTFSKESNTFEVGVYNNQTFPTDDEQYRYLKYLKSNKSNSVPCTIIHPELMLSASKCLSERLDNYHDKFYVVSLNDINGFTHSEKTFEQLLSKSVSTDVVMTRRSILPLTKTILTNNTECLLCQWVRCLSPMVVVNQQNNIIH